VTPEPRAAPPTETGFDHVVVGVGAGGWPPAANLAAAGPRTLLLKVLPFTAARYRNDARHGFDGWLPTALADPELAVPGFPDSSSPPPST
jgi:hypothetical protein